MLGHTSAKVTLDTYADLFDDDIDAVAVALHSHYSRENAAMQRPEGLVVNHQPAVYLHRRVEKFGGGGGI